MKSKSVYICDKHPYAYNPRPDKCFECDMKEAVRLMVEEKARNAAVTGAIAKRPWKKKNPKTIEKFRFCKNPVCIHMAGKSGWCNKHAWLRSEEERLLGEQDTEDQDGG